MARKNATAARPSPDPAVAAFDVVNRLTGTTPPKAKATPKKRRPRQKPKPR